MRMEPPSALVCSLQGPQRQEYTRQAEGSKAAILTPQKQNCSS